MCQTKAKWRTLFSRKCITDPFSEHEVTHRSGLYNLRSRYYDPETGRFVSADHPLYLRTNMPNGLNPYAYCYNNPIKYVDNTGCSAGFALIALIVMGLTVISLHSDYAIDPKKQHPLIEPTGDDFIKYEFENGEVLYYAIKNGADSQHNLLVIYDSWRYGIIEMGKFLSDLNAAGYEININKVMNEWQWHNIAYGLFGLPNAKDVDVYFDADDEGHGLFSWIMNHWRWF